MKKQNRATTAAPETPAAKIKPPPPVAVIGRPNAGKSTLLNALAGRKASIVSHKRQTTRATIRASCQCRGMPVVFADTPGWQSRYVDAFSRALNSGAEQSAAAAVVVVYVVAAPVWHEEDSQLLLRLPPQCDIIIAANKTDLLPKRDLLLPFFADIDAACKTIGITPRAIVPVSALKRRGLQPLLGEVADALPMTNETKNMGDNTGVNNINNNDNDDAFSFAEILREQLFARLGGELPYRAAVIARTTAKRGKTLHINAEVFVEKESQKAIVIGAGGEALKETATRARKQMERIAGEKICLTVRVRARKWRQDNELLAQMRIGMTD